MTTLENIDSAAENFAALGRLASQHREPMARCVIEVPLRELKYTAQGEDFPLVQWYGFDLEVCDSDYELVSDHYNEWLRDHNHG